MNVENDLLKNNLDYLKFKWKIKSNLELAKHISCPASTLQSYINNPTKKSAVRYALADFFGVNADQLENEDLTKKTSNNAYNDYYDDENIMDEDVDSFLNAEELKSFINDLIFNTPLNSNLSWKPTIDYSFNAETVSHIIDGFDPRDVEGYQYESDYIKYYIIALFNSKNDLVPCHYYCIEHISRCLPKQLDLPDYIVKEFFSFLHDEHYEEFSNLYYHLFDKNQSSKH